MTRIPQISEEQAQHFWSQVRKGDPSECWPWTGGNSHGYGSTSFAKVPYRTHIISYFLTVGIWPSGRLIMHSCDYRRCCNPKHLTDGTHQLNCIDMFAKGRGAKVRCPNNGSRNPQCPSV